MTSNFTPAPIQILPIIADKKTGREVIHPLWIKWYNDVYIALTGVIPGVALQHNNLGGLQGGSGGDYYHLSAANGGNQSANRVYAGPTSGGSAAPAFRALVAADMPATVPLTNASNTFTLVQVMAGTVTNDSAAAGNLGEYVTATVATGASISLATATAKTITSISLTAGDWDVTGVVDYTFDATTSVTDLAQGISTTTDTLGAQDTYSSVVTPASVPTAANDAALVTPLVRISIASTTTVYLIAKGTFTVSTLKGYGTIRARRVR